MSKHFKDLELYNTKGQLESNCNSKTMWHVHHEILCHAPVDKNLQ